MSSDTFYGIEFNDFFVFLAENRMRLTSTQPKEMEGEFKVVRYILWHLFVDIKEQLKLVKSNYKFLLLKTSRRSHYHCVSHFRYHHFSRHRPANSISPSLPYLHFTSPAAIPTCHGENGVVIRILKISPHSGGVGISMQVGPKIFASLFRQLEKQIELADWVGNLKKDGCDVQEIMDDGREDCWLSTVAVPWFTGQMTRFPLSCHDQFISKGKKAKFMLIFIDTKQEYFDLRKTKLTLIFVNTKQEYFYLRKTKFMLIFNDRKTRIFWSCLALSIIRSNFFVC